MPRRPGSLSRGWRYPAEKPFDPWRRASKRASVDVVGSSFSLVSSSPWRRASKRASVDVVGSSFSLVSSSPWRRASKRASVDVVGSSFSSNPWKSSKSSDGAPSFASTGTFASTGAPSFAGTSPRDSNSAVILSTALGLEDAIIDTSEICFMDSAADVNEWQYKLKMLDVCELIEKKPICIAAHLDYNDIEKKDRHNVSEGVVETGDETGISENCNWDEDDNDLFLSISTQEILHQNDFSSNLREDISSQ
uniref:Uncharacterized protein n=1 Tax=Glossina pallidipes TaxID=7398 RepID=A0A1A9ZB69_GLOPL